MENIEIIGERKKMKKYQFHTCTFKLVAGNSTSNIHITGMVL